MRNKILQVLKEHFQYNDYKLGKIADEIVEALEIKKPVDRYCEKCIHSKTLIVTYVGKNPNLCQRGRPKGDAINCPYYTEGAEIYDRTDYSTITKTFR